jgi:hypothetical protein
MLEMDANLQGIKAALAEISEPDLHALIAAATKLERPLPAPGLMAWIETACDWELNGRLGLVYPLLPPEAVIPPEENAASINVAVMLRGMFSERSLAVRILFDALVMLLSAASGSTSDQAASPKA